MEMTLNLAGIEIAIRFLGQAQKATALCEYYFQDFLCRPTNRDAQIKVSHLGNICGDIPFQPAVGLPVFEQRLPARKVAAWLSHIPQCRQDFAVNDDTLCAFCQDGLLLFDPNTAAGHIYLLDPGPACFRPLHRLFWMYFAQVLGEKNGCFVHCAALASNQLGYLFWGDSGAGKSTVANLCREGIVFSDDSPIFLKENGNYFVYPSPFHQLDPKKDSSTRGGTHRAKVNGFYFLIQDEQVFLETASKRRAFSMILKRYIHFFPYLTALAKSNLFDVFFDACNTIPTYYLHFGRSLDVWDVIRNG